MNLFEPWSKWADIGVEYIEERHLQPSESERWPFAFEYSFKGGKDEDIAKVIYDNIGICFLYELVGDIAVEVDSVFGRKVVVRFSRVED